MANIDFKYYNEVRALSEFIYQHPEIGYEEQQAVDAHSKLLTSLGFNVEIPYPNLPTAFKVEFSSPYMQSDCKTVAFFSEYDALKDFGHACGHNLIAASAVTAFLQSVELCKTHKLNAKVILFGTPAEESFGGKIALLREGAFKGVDCGLINHPYYRNGFDSGTLAVSRFDVDFTGKSAHAACSPSDGINALDAMISFFSNIGMYRQQMDKNSMIHGIITNGGKAPNIIPDLTQSFFYLRSATNEGLKILEKNFMRIAQGSALAHNCQVKIQERPYTYLASQSNQVLENLLLDEFNKLNWNSSKIEEKISSDYANLSVEFPLCNFFFGIVEDTRKVPLHSLEFLELAQTPYAFAQAIQAGLVMSQVFFNFSKKTI